MLATIGFFDGVHRGHQYLISQVIKLAHEQGMVSAVVTFDCHPQQVLQGKTIQLLTPIDEKRKRLEAAGIEKCIVLPFTQQLSKMSAYDFMRMLRDDYDINALLIGFDNCFGHNRKEGFDQYVEYGHELGMNVMHAEPLLNDGIKISSSHIKSLINSGDISKANELLGYNYCITGKVVEGKHIGRSIGFPTANIGNIPDEKIIPKEGVYAAMVNGRKAMLNIGTNPTISDNNKTTVEAHIINFNGNIYGEVLTIEILHRVRDEQHFASIEALKQQLHLDLTTIIRTIKSHLQCKLRGFFFEDAYIISSWCKSKRELRLWSADRYKDYPVTPSEIIRMYEGDGKIPLTMMEGERIVGHIMLRYPSEDKDVIRLCFVIVDNALRGKGYGRELLQLSINYARDILHAKRITLGVFCDNRPAFECYKTLGFTVIDNVSYIIDGEEWKGYEMELLVSNLPLL